ncbi:MAG: C1 family peptidase, partial [Bdellovibrionales bacterium]|nr:C1 family peptidase [Bdellovibrionales bacterium]
VIPAIAFAGNSQMDMEGAYLDPPYAIHQPPKVKSVGSGPEEARSLDRAVVRNDFETLIQKQTPVRAQEKRGTCSIFSATALLEFHLVELFDLIPTLDLSEEWLEYLATRNRTSDGSNSWTNFNLIDQFGMPDEKLLPYIGMTWKKESLPPLAVERCGHLTGVSFSSCLLGHRDPNLLFASEAQLLDPSSGLYDPEFLYARRAAREVKEAYINYSSRDYVVRYVNEIQDLLDQGIPLTLGAAFFYGSWNHRTAPELGMARDMNGWYKGIVGYPEPGSVDAVMSPTKEAGHSIVIVGYDNEKRVTTRIRMVDGTMKSFTYTGVYYFKNSWGKDGFGRDFSIDGRPYPGYGMITQKYAHEYGTFFRLPLVRMGDNN